MNFLKSILGSGLSFFIKDFAEIPSNALLQSRHPGQNMGRMHRLQIAAAKRPASIHHETRQLRRQRERLAKKGRTA